MSTARWVLLVCFAVFLANSLRALCRVAAGGSADLALPRGKASRGVAYSFTGGMLPWKKESARLHPIVYVLGVAYHAGTFLAFSWLVVIAVGASLPPVLKSVSAVVLAATALAGVALLARRFADAKLRYFSSPDDYFSNILVTGFHALTALALVRPAITGTVLVYAGILLVYIPLGKLRHALYFGLARYYLGIFYGRRGVWPAEGERTWRSRKP